MDRSTWKHMGAMVACAFIGFFPFVRGVRVPLLGLFDFGMHELGHLLFIWAGETIHFLAGSATQVLVPAGLAAYFWWWRRDLAPSALMVAWTGANLHDVSVYIADAPYERLPLIGGDHDWAFLLHKYDVMDAAAPLAAWIKGLGGMAVIAAIGVAALGPWIEERMTRTSPKRVWVYGPVQSTASAADTADDPWD